uniref:Uncharacterized protein n=1 Tax=Chloropicon laureae TaxID=464258 RepID=A0A7S2Z2P8_9CHLO
MASTVEAEARERKAQRLKERGNSFYVRHQLTQAIDWYTQALEANPKAYDVYTNRAAAYAALKMWDEGLADAKAAVKLNPAWLKGYWRQGMCHVELKQYREAVAAFERARELNPSSEQVLGELKKCRERLALMPETAGEAKRQGNQCFKRGAYDEALRLYKEALKLAEQESAGDGTAAAEIKATVLVNAAEAYRQLGEYEKVIEQCDLAIGLKEGRAGEGGGAASWLLKAHLRRALASEKLERYGPAQRDFRAVIERDPTNHIASSGLIRCARGK